MTEQPGSWAYTECADLLDRYFKVAQKSRDSELSVRRLLIDAKILLVCEDLYRHKTETGRLENLSSLERQLSDVLTNKNELVETVRQRLFDENHYWARLHKVKGIYSQLSEAEYFHMKIRPAGS